MESPLVSVIIPAYNAAVLVAETIDSVLAQNYPSVEILVVDDGSTDETAKVLQCYGDRIRYFHQENWGGPSRPRNVGLRNATGELVAFFDADDLMAPEKLQTAVDVFERFPKVDFTFSSFRGIQEDGATHRADFLERYQNFRSEIQSEEGSTIGVMAGRAVFRQLLGANFIGTSSVVCRRSVFDQVGEFDESMLNADDVDMWRRIAYAGYQFAFIDEILHSYRKTAGGISAGGAKRYPAILSGIRKQLQLELEADERALLNDKINQLELGYAAALGLGGDRAAARRVYREVLAKKVSWTGIKGLVKYVLPG